MKGVVICIGSNVADSEVNVNNALKFVYDNFSAVKATEPYLTEAEGYVAGCNQYLNCVVIAETQLSESDLRQLLKTYETGAGRLPEHKVLHTIPIDVDVVIYDGKIVDNKEYISSYFQRGLEMLNQISSNNV